MIVVVEHLEPCISKWLLKEYEFVAEIFKGRVIFTNVVNDHDRLLLESLGTTYRVSVVELLQDKNNVIVLDPSAKDKLQIDDVKIAEYIIIGGIMGDNPPKGRTRLQITSRLKNALPRNIGEKQFTIAGAAYVLKQVEMGRNVDDVRYIFGLKIRKRLSSDIEIEVELPYAFPLDEWGNVVLPKGYQDVVLEHTIVFESALLTGKHDVC